MAYRGKFPSISNPAVRKILGLDEMGPDDMGVGAGTMFTPGMGPQATTRLARGMGGGRFAPLGVADDEMASAKTMMSPPRGLSVRPYSGNQLPGGEAPFNMPPVERGMAPYSPPGPPMRFAGSGSASGAPPGGGGSTGGGGPMGGGGWSNSDLLKAAALVGGGSVAAAMAHAAYKNLGRGGEGAGMEPPVTPTAKQGQNYAAERGDTLFGIAEAMLGPGASHQAKMALVQEIAKANSIGDINKIDAGQNLVLPGGMMGPAKKYGLPRQSGPMLPSLRSPDRGMAPPDPVPVDMGPMSGGLGGANARDPMFMAALRQAILEQSQGGSRSLTPPTTRRMPPMP